MESVALYSFQATEKDELPFQKGDTLKVWGAGVSPAMGRSPAMGGGWMLLLWGTEWAHSVGRHRCFHYTWLCCLFGAFCGV